MESQHRQGREPDHHDQAERATHLGRAMNLEHEQASQYQQGDGNHQVAESRRRHLQTFDRRQHRDGRGDGPVTVEQGGAGQAQHQHQPACPERHIGGPLG